MKKILFVISTLNTGGAQKILSNFVMNLPDEYEAFILLNDTENIVYPYKGNIISLGFQPKEDKLNLWYQWRVFFRRIRQMRKLKATGEYIATVSFMDSANIANIISGKKHCKTILSVHNNLTESTASWVYKYFVNPMVRILYGSADKIIAVSKGISFDLVNNLKLTNKNIVTIYNGHDIGEIRKLSQIPFTHEVGGGLKGYPVIATMGRMDYQKGQWHLIRALTKVKEKFPEVRLLLLGEGELYSYLKHLVKECELENHIIFCGFMKNPFSILAKSDAFVLPSMYEGFPNALVEALSCELPCVATDFRSGAREILAPELPINEQIKDTIYKAKFGVLTPVCNGKQYNGKAPLTDEELFLAEGIITLLQDKELQMDYRKRSDEAVKKLSIEIMVQKWLEVIDS